MIRHSEEKYVCCEDCEMLVPRSDTFYGVCYNCLCSRIISRCGDRRLKAFLIDHREELTEHLRRW